MRLEETEQSRSESTVDFDAPHPAREFLEACGFDVSKFPRVRVVLELSRGLLKNSQSFIPLRLPSKPGFVYESFARVMRNVELPTATQGHRKFVEVEWAIDENPLLEIETHAAFSFVSGEVQCPSCKCLFVPDAQVVDESAIRMTCPSCMHYWTIRVEASKDQQATANLLTDLYYRDPARIRWAISNLGPNSRGGEFFPAQFKAWDDELSMGWLFEDRKGFVETQLIFNEDFDLLWKSFLNSRFLRYFQDQREPKLTSSLESTEVFRKSELTSKPSRPTRTPATNALQAEFPMEITMITEEPSVTSGEIKFRPSTSVYRTHPREVSRSKVGLAVASGAALALLGVGAFAFYTLKPTETVTAVSSSMIPTELPKVEAPKSEVPKVEAKVEAPKVEQKIEPKTEIPPLEIKAEESAKLLEADRAREKAEQLARTRAIIIESSLKSGAKFMESEQFGDASKEFEKVLELDPENAGAYQNLGISYVYAKRYNEAIAAFEKYLKLAKDDKDKAYIQEMLVTLKGQKDFGTE